MALSIANDPGNAGTVVRNIVKDLYTPGEKITVRENEIPGKRDTRKILEEEGQDAIRIDRDEGGNPKEIWVRWHCVESFYASTSTDRHYLVDPVVGKVIFGDGRRGMIPPPGASSIVAFRYMTGGGVVGNVGAGSITVSAGFRFRRQRFSGSFSRSWPFWACRSWSLRATPTST